MSRFKIAGTHLAVSTAIAVLVGMFILFVWYPPPLFNVLDGRILLGMIVGINACLGPLMTFLIFNPDKARKALVLDLSIIAAIQVAALIYSLHVAFAGRPAYVVYGQGYFVAVTANSYEDMLLKGARDPKFRTLPLWGPRWIGTRLPTHPEGVSDADYAKVVDLLKVHYQPNYYVEWSNVKDEIVREAKPLQQLLAGRPAAAPYLNQILANLDKKAEEVGYLPLRTKRQTLTVLIDKSSGAVLGTEEIDPNGR